MAATGLFSKLPPLPQPTQMKDTCGLFFTAISHRVMRLRQDEEKPTNVDFPG